ncbi:MAG: hypothetical protein IT459_24080, partial [Planctomycetes bacterium]|nr:hypothetical protein [Planctomycetota bacterium]
MEFARPRLRMPVLCAAAVVCVAAAGSADAAGPIATFAGGGTQLGDGGQATNALLLRPRRVAFSGANVLVVEFGSVDAGEANISGGRVRSVSPGGVITTLAGTGQFNGATDLAVIPGGGGAFLVADEFNPRGRRVASGGALSTVAGGNGEGCTRYVGALAGASATAAVMAWPRSLAMYPNGDYLILDESCGLVHRVSGGAITTVAGAGGAGYSGDGGPALSAQLNNPRGVAVARDGGFYIADSLNHRIRRVWPDGVITTVAGVGTPGSPTGGRPATSVPLNTPRDVDEAADGSVAIADSSNNAVRLVAPDGLISTL